MLIKPDNNTRKIKVVVVEDHPIYRQGITANLKNSAGFEIVDEVESGYAALMACEKFKPDLLLLDLTLKGTMSGNDVILYLRETGSQIKIVVISANEYALSRNPVDIGADRCLLKTAGREELLQTLLEVIAEPSRADYIPDFRRRDGREKGQDKLLTEHDLDAIKLGAKGLTHLEIGLRLGIKEQTTSTFLSRIFAKIGVKNMAQAVAFAYSNNLIQPGSRTIAKADYFHHKEV